LLNHVSSKPGAGHAYPFLASKKVQIGGRLGMAVLKSISKPYIDLPEIKLSDLATPKADLYVFDDLERCEMPINKSLGYINEFVEQEGRKVVIIANEGEIRQEERDEYNRRREKLIGKTFEVQSVFDEAFNSFIQLVGDPEAKSFMETKRADISDVYSRSSLNNLRILQQTIWDFARFFGALTERHLKRVEGVTALLRSFFALSFEFKSGRLRQGDLKDWVSTSIEYSLLKHVEDRQPSRCHEAVERYQYEIDLSGTILSTKLVEDIFVKGIVDYLEIRSYLDTTSYFVDPGTELPWRTVWHWVVRTEEEFNTAYNRWSDSSLQENFSSQV
jgi:hypothetical protein